MSDKGMSQHKEIAMGVAGKYETSPSMKGGKRQTIAPMNKKCGGPVKRKKK